MVHRTNQDKDGRSQVFLKSFIISRKITNRCVENGILGVSQRHLSSVRISISTIVHDARID